MKYTPCEIVSSPRASERIRAAAAFLEALPAGTEALVVAASREAADDLVRGISLGRGATFGIHRMTLNRLAGLLASDHLNQHGLAPAAGLAIEAITARVVHRLKGTGALAYFEPVIDRPGFPRALARTISELRLNRIFPNALRGQGEAADALANALDEFEAEMRAAKLADRASILTAAADSLRANDPPRFAGIPCAMLDVAIETTLESILVAALCSRAPSFLATIPAGDELSQSFLENALKTNIVELADEKGSQPNSLRRLQDHLFSNAPQESRLDDTVTVVSAPGEMHEAVEIARRIQDEARNGITFDRIAVLCHVGERYAPYLEEALNRAGIPTYFATGTRRPEPGGRALLALLTCAAENLSASRFAEYLSLAQVPDPGAHPDDAFVPPDAEVFSGPLAADLDTPPELPQAEPDELSPVPVAEGTVRAPWQWEKLLVDAAVIGSNRARWERRLRGLEAELNLRRDALAEDEKNWRASIERKLVDLADLENVALPIIDRLAARPSDATWGEWLVYLRSLVALAIRNPNHVLAALAELEAMGPVGPLGLDEVRAVLAKRMGHLEDPIARRRYGHVFVAPPAYARGMQFDLVIVPGLAERMFPKKLTEDPILSDSIRRKVSADLKTQDVRVGAERLALRLTAGAATRTVMFSYPRVDLDQGRPRVPSFYSLEVLRAAEGRLPGFDELARRAACEQATRLGWPAPGNPDVAIDTAEFDLAVLSKLVDKDPQETIGAAHYLLKNDAGNPHLPRALRARARRWLRRWTPADGLVDPTPETLAVVASTQALDSRSFSPTALQLYASCPYRFLLQAIFRLAPREEAIAMEVIDPLTKGSLTHEIQYELLTHYRSQRQLPITPATLDAAYASLDRIVKQVTGEWYDKLAPAIDRVWRDGVDSIRADLREWIRRQTENSEGWNPQRFELAFGLPDRAKADPASSPDAIPIGRLRLRGSIDLVESDGHGHLRITDHKTGKVRAKKGVVIGGGKTLQPVLYALAAEQMLTEPVAAGRLYYCTATGGYEERTVPIDERARIAANLFIDTIDAALREGFLPAAPDAGECRWCDYRRVCGPYEEQRVKNKPGGDKDRPGATPGRMDALWKLRAQP